MLKNSEIIAIFNLRDNQSNIYRDYINKYKHKYKIIDLSEEGAFASCIVTKDTIYLSAISSMTLKKRLEEGFLADSIYSNFDFK